MRERVEEKTKQEKNERESRSSIPRWRDVQCAWVSSHSATAAMAWLGVASPQTNCVHLLLVKA